MKEQSIKKVLLYTALLFLAGCFFVACSKSGLRPKNGFVNSKNDSDSIIAAKPDTSPTFYSPTGIAVDAAGNIYVADAGNNMIRKITASGVVSTLAGSGTEGSVNAMGALATFAEPTSVTVDKSGNLYVADYGNDLIRKIDGTGLVTTLAGADSAGVANGTGVTAAFFGPAGVAVDDAGNVYVADAGNNLIRAITPAGVVTTVAGNVATGTSSLTTFSNPTGVAVGAGGNLFVADYLNNTILQINPAGNVSNLAGNGQPLYVDGPGGTASFYFPRSIAVDKNGNVYVADEVNNLIRKITPDATVSTLAGSGMPGAVDSTGAAVSFNGPGGVAVDGAGNVYVADTGNDLIRKITPAGVVTTIAGNGHPGSKNGQAVAYKSNIKFAVVRKRISVIKSK